MLLNYYLQYPSDFIWCWKLMIGHCWVVELTINIVANLVEGVQQMPPDFAKYYKHDLSVQTCVRLTISYHDGPDGVQSVAASGWLLDVKRYRPNGYPNLQVYPPNDRDGWNHKWTSSLKVDESCVPPGWRPSKWRIIMLYSATMWTLITQYPFWLT